MSLLIRFGVVLVLAMPMVHMTLQWCEEQVQTYDRLEAVCNVPDPLSLQNDAEPLFAYGSVDELAL